MTPTFGLTGMTNQQFADQLLAEYQASKGRNMNPDPGPCGFGDALIDNTTGAYPMNQVAPYIPETSAAPHTVPAPPVNPMNLLQTAVANGNLDLAEKLMGLQERWEANQSRKAFDEAISSAKAEIPPIERNATGHNSKKYADFAAIAAVVDPILSKHGLSYRFRTQQTDRIAVTCILSHKAGHSEETTLVGPADQSGNKNAIQAIGSTLTYLQRYSLVQMLGLAAARDDDGKAGAGKPTITQEQADEIRDALESNGKDRTKFLKWAKVERIEDIPADTYQSCLDAAKFKAAK
jgi:hypothetical protein